MDICKIGIDVRLWNETGIGRYIRNLVKSLSDLDKEHQYILFGLSKDIEEIKLHISGNQNFIVIPANISWHGVEEQVKFPQLLNKYKLDLMHFPYFSVPIFYNKPFVVTVHDLIINNFPTGKASTLPLPFYLVKRLGYNYILKNAISKSKKILVPSHSTKQEVLDTYTVPEEKIVVTPEGVDTSIIDFKPSIFKPKKPYFLYVGNAYPHKNLETLISAFSIFSQNNPNYELKLVGKNDFFYERLKKRSHSNRIEFVGYVSDMDLAKLYKFSTATFVPSLMEGFGLTALEAISSSSIICCSDIPSLKEVCEKNAIYFNPKDVLSLEQAMVKVSSLNRTERMELIKKGKKHIEKFSWEKMGKTTIDVYHSCL